MNSPVIDDLLAIAQVCHEANRALCMTQGDMSQPPWTDAPEWQKESALNGVQFHYEHPDAKPEHSHENWLAEKLAAGWKYGPVKDPDKLEHPCCVPFEELPYPQQAKDRLFIAICHALIPGIRRGEVAE